MLHRPEHVKAEIAKGQDRRVACGNSLYLLVRNGKGFWELRYRDGSAIRSHGLGPASGENAVTPAAARRAREAFMADKRRGIVVVPRRAKGEAFGVAAAAYLDNHADEWSPRTRADNKALVRKYVPADFAAMPVTTITAEHVADVLRPVWNGPGNNRGSRLRRLMAGILAAKNVHPNPARWNDGPLPELLSRKRADVKHREAMPWPDVPAFVAALGDSTEDRAGKFAILTAVRRKEALGARWGEFDLASRVWTIPGERMKKPGGKVPPPHSVPLTGAMIACLGKPGEPDAFVFPSSRTGGMLGNKACDKEWHDLAPFTLHGFRTSFATWAEEQDDGRMYPPSVIEAALAHAKGKDKSQGNEKGNATTQAYLRSDFFQARRKLMEAWNEFATGKQR
jgi:integrase